VHEEHKAAWKNGKPQDQWITTLTTYAFPRIGNRLVSDIEGPVIRDVLAAIWLSKPETARRVRQRIGVVLDWSYAKRFRTTEAPLRSISRGLPRQHTYELSYPAPGAPELAQRMVELLTQAGLPAQTDPTRGFDHGVFVPFLLVDPDAHIPVVPLSLRSNLDAAEHLAAGRALASLRDEGILIVGSGMSYHDMRSFFTPAARKPSARFDRWLTQAVEADPATRWDRLSHWSSGDAGRSSHPREEHLLPLMVAAGAGADSSGTRAFGDNVMMADISAFRFG